MTNEEAIVFLAERLELQQTEFPEIADYGEALTLAISALESIDSVKNKLNARDKLVDKLEDRVYKLTAERDAAIADMEDIVKKVNVACGYCKNLREKAKLLRDETMRESKCFNCECFSSWEWRGIENEKS